MELAPRISAAIKPGGWLALSGILASQVSCLFLQMPLDWRPQQTIIDTMP